MDIDNIFIIADTHFDHKNILELEDRPFKNVGEMNDTLIKNWNSVTNSASKIYILGDFALSNIGNMENILNQLNGLKYLVKGNHDSHSNKRYRELGFKEVYDHPIYYNQYLIFSHRPVKSKGHLMVNVHGHIHKSKPHVARSNPSYMCVSAELIQYTPITLQSIYNLYSIKE